MDGEDFRIVAADSVPMTVVWRAFVDGFQGYVVPVQIELGAFVQMITAEQVELSASLVALDRRDQPLGMALLAIRDRRGWCGGLGVEPAFRRRGLGRRLMTELIDEARNRSLETVDLECIDGNEAARTLYEDLGFRARRRLDIFEGVPISRPMRHLQNLKSWTVADPTSLWRDFAEYHVAPRAWQIDEAALRISIAGKEMRALAIGDLEYPDAYVQYRPPVGSGGRVALVDAGCRRAIDESTQMLAALVGDIADEYPGCNVSASNVGEDEPLNSALRSLAIPTRLSQTEMVLAIR